RPRRRDPCGICAGHDALRALSRGTQPSSGRIRFAGRRRCGIAGDDRLSGAHGRSNRVAMSSALDLVVRGGNIVTPDGVRKADLGVAGGRIVKIAAGIADAAAATLDAAGRWVFPGIIDAHVHFNEPGRTEWEGLATGSAALVAGGGTAFFDMPLNSEPPVLD